jgi:AraC-like DNA-binding protein
MSSESVGDGGHLTRFISFARAGSTIYPPGGRYGPRVQPYLELCLIYSGQVDIHVDDKIYLVPARHIALLKPGIHEDFYFSKVVETRQRWVHIGLNEVDPHTENMLASLPFSIPLSDKMDQLTDVLQAMTYNSSGASTENIHSELRCTLAAAVISLFHLESLTIRVEGRKHRSVIQTKIKIHDSYAEPLNLRELAAMSGVSREYLIRAFREAEEMTPIRYLWKIRANHALDLLQRTGLTLEKIAERTGFQSVYHLSRMIKNVTGQTSMEIRHRSLDGKYVQMRDEEHGYVDME